MVLRVLLMLAVVVTSAPVLAQVTFTSGVDVVRFDIRVVDADGRPITDLRPDEIVTEAGQTLPLVLFQRVTEPSGSYVEDAIRAVSAEVSSNEAFPRGHLYILIFDQQHITPGNEQRARIAAENFIRRHVRPSDRVALFAVPGPGPQIGFTATRPARSTNCPRCAAATSDVSNGVRLDDDLRSASHRAGRRDARRDADRA